METLENDEDFGCAAFGRPIQMAKGTVGVRARAWKVVSHAEGGDTKYVEEQKSAAGHIVSADLRTMFYEVGNIVGVFDDGDAFEETGFGTDPDSRKRRVQKEAERLMRADVRARMEAKVAHMVDPEKNKSMSSEEEEDDEDDRGADESDR